VTVGIEDSAEGLAEGSQLCDQRHELEVAWLVVVLAEWVLLQKRESQW
jgi:hypothetical protein